jgi:tyrosyl-tRNA synthetase
MKLSEELRWRGFLNQTTYADLTALDKRKVSFYHGFDATADSQTVGNLASMMLDRLFMKHGHKAIILAGGATSLIGDPGGKDKERPLLSGREVAKNVSKAEAQLKKIFKGHRFQMVNNLKWTKKMKVIDFLRDYGKHFSMTPLIQRDYIAKRLGTGGSGISYAEFSYTVLQGMDYLQLHDRYGVTLQLGGSDQWGNILSGVELIRRVRATEVHALTQPLIINKTSGKKFGKSEAGAVWLDPKKTDPVKEFYQFWLNTDDDSVEVYLKIFTEIEPDELKRLMAEFKKDKAPRLAQRRLAFEVTKLVHGAKIAKKAEKYATSLISNQAQESLAINVKPHEATADVLVRAGLAGSKTEARRFLKEGAIYANNQTFDKETLQPSDFKDGKILLRRGKRVQHSVIVELDK